MKKSIIALALTVSFMGSAMAQSITGIGNGGALAASTIFSIKHLAELEKKSQEQRKKIALKREQNRAAKKLLAQTSKDIKEQKTSIQ